MQLLNERGRHVQLMKQSYWVQGSIGRIIYSDGEHHTMQMCDSNKNGTNIDWSNQLKI